MNNLPATIIPGKRRVYRKRPKRGSPTPPPPPENPAVVSVQRVDDTNCVWTFNCAIVDVGDPSGFIAGADIANGVNWVAGNQMSLGYSDPINVGDGWSVDPASITTVFDSPGTLDAQSGTIS